MNVSSSSRLNQNTDCLLQKCQGERRELPTLALLAERVLKRLAPQQLAAMPLPQGVGFKRYRLPNGMELCFCNEKAVNDEPPCFSLRLKVKGGAATEPEGLEGAAHLIEHLAFGCIKTVEGKRSWVEFLEKAGIPWGSHNNATTSLFDVTYQLDSIPSDDPELLKVIVKIIRGWTDGIVFDQEAIDKEREIILHEFTETPQRDYHATCLGMWLKNRVDPTIARLPIGVPQKLLQRMRSEGNSIWGASRPEEWAWSDEDLQFTAQQLKDYYEATYRPERMVLIIAGDLGPAAEFLEELLKSCSEIPAGRQKAPLCPVVEKEKIPLEQWEELKKVAVCYQGVEACEAQVGFPPYKIAPITTFGSYRESVAAFIAAEAIVKHLQKILKHDAPLAKKVAICGVRPPDGSGGWEFPFLKVISNFESMPKSIFAVGRVVKECCSFPITAEEIKDISKNFIDVVNVNIISPPSSLSWILNHYDSGSLLMRSRNDFLLAKMIALGTIGEPIDGETVRKIFVRSFSSFQPAFCRVVASQEEEAAKLLALTCQELENLDKCPLENRFLELAPRVKEGFGPRPAVKAGSVVKSSPLDAISGEKLELSNGVNVYLIACPSNDGLVHFQFLNPIATCGHSRVQRDHHLVAFNVWKALWKDWELLYSNVPGNGLYLDSEGFLEWEISLPENEMKDKFFDMLHTCLTDFSFENSDEFKGRFAIFKERIITYMQEQLKNPESRALHGYENALFNGHPMMTFSQEEALEAWSALSLSLGRELLRATLQMAEGASLIVVGDFERKEQLKTGLCSLLETHLASIPTVKKGVVSPFHAPSYLDPAKSLTQYALLDSRKVEVKLTFARPVERGKVVENALSSIFLPYIRERLRLQDSNLYGVSGHARAYPGVFPPLFSLSWTSSTDIHEQTTAAFQKALNELLEGRADQELLQYAENDKVYLEKLFKTTIDPEFWRGAIKNSLKAGNDPNGIPERVKRTLERPLEVTVSQLKTAIPPYEKWFRFFNFPQKVFENLASPEF